MLALISQGRFDEALPYAEKLKTVPEVERFSRLALAVDAFRKKDYHGRRDLAEAAARIRSRPADLRVMTAWAKAGAGDANGALAILDKLQGPEWYGLFVTYHRALIAERPGSNDEADAAYQAALDDVAAGGAAPETWLRAAEAYAGFLARKGEKDEALRARQGRRVSRPGGCRSPPCATRSTRASRSRRWSTDPSDGASEVLLDLGTALNRGGGEAFVRLYLQYALALKPDSDVVLVQLAAVAEQQEDAEEAIALYRRIPATSPLKRCPNCSSASTLPTSTATTRRSRSSKTLLDAEPRRHARLSGAGRRLCLQGGLSAPPPRSTTRRSRSSRSAKTPTRRQLEHLLPARHRL